MSVLDIMICVFVSLSAVNKGAFSSTDRITNLTVSLILVVLFALFVGLIIVSTFKMKAKIAKVQDAFDVSVNKWFKDLYDGFREIHPEKFCVVKLMFIFRLVVYAAVVVFLQSQPAFQLLALIISSVMYNATVAKMKPYYSWHNTFLHYFNECSFCAFVIVSLLFTPFMADTNFRATIA